MMSEPPLPSSGQVLLAGMLARIALVLFTIEAVIMIGLSEWTINRQVLTEGFIDATALTLVSTPIIYLWVVRPFVEKTRQAQAALAAQAAIKAEQAQALEIALRDQAKLLEQNEGLQNGLRRSNADAARSNESMLQRIGGDLHDGPAQLLSFALLRYSAFERHARAQGLSKKEQDNLEGIKAAIADSLREIRNISSGLAPPGLNSATLEQTIELAIAAHELHTNTHVDRQIDVDAGAAPLATRVCIYRFVQEALTNSYRHAGGVQQRVSCAINASGQDGRRRVQVTVADQGPGFCVVSAAGIGIGLNAMRSRISALGGELDVRSTKGGTGATLTATLDLHETD